MRKRIIILIIIIFILLISVIVFILIRINKVSESPCEKIEKEYCILKGVPEYLRFQEATPIPLSESYNSTKNPPEDYFIIVDENDHSKGHLCTDSNELTKSIWYFEKICDEDDYECFHTRRASVCATFYVVQEFKKILDNQGQVQVLRYTYGPYDLPE